MSINPNQSTNYQQPPNHHNPQLQREFLQAVERTLYWCYLQNDREITTQQIDKRLQVHDRVLHAFQQSQQQLAEEIEVAATHPLPPLESLQNVHVNMHTHIPAPPPTNTSHQIEQLQATHNVHSRLEAEHHAQLLHTANQNSESESRTLDERLEAREKARAERKSQHQPLPQPEPPPAQSNFIWLLISLLRDLFLNQNTTYQYWNR